MIKSFHSFQSYTQLHSFYFHQLGVSSVQIFSSHYLILFLLSSLGETSCWSKVSWEPDQFIYSPHTLSVIVIAWEKKVVDQKFHEFDQFIYSPHTSSHSSYYLHWEKQVVDQKFHEFDQFIYSFSHQLMHTLLTIFSGRNNLQLYYIHVQCTIIELGQPEWTPSLPKTNLTKPRKLLNPEMSNKI